MNQYGITCYAIHKHIHIEQNKWMLFTWNNMIASGAAVAAVEIELQWEVGKIRSKLIANSRTSSRHSQFVPVHFCCCWCARRCHISWYTNANGTVAWYSTNANRGILECFNIQLDWDYCQHSDISGSSMSKVKVELSWLGQEEEENKNV